MAEKEIDKFLKMGRQIGASDLHMVAGSVPTFRLHGALRRIKFRDLTQEDLARMAKEILTPEQMEEFLKEQELDFSYRAEGLGRCRANLCMANHGWNLTMRLISDKIMSMEELGLPPVVKKLLDYRQGLILVTGSTGCGKSTTLAAMVDYLNRTRHEHIICLEDPVEIVHQSKNCHIIQREVGVHTASFARALRAALREDPDIIMVGEMRDLETISNAITAAETGHLVLGTLHTTSAARTVSRILDVFPPSQQEQIRAMVAGSLRGVLTQQLVPRADGQGRVLCVEVMVNTPAISNLIQKDQMYQIESQMQTGMALGMRLMDDALYALLNRGLITPETAMERANDRSKFADLSRMREKQVNWTYLLTLQDDKQRRREIERRSVVAKDPHTKKMRIPPKQRVPFLFYQDLRGKLPEDEIYAELLRLYPDHVVGKSGEE